MTNKNEIMIFDEQKLRNKIYLIRGIQVMLDIDLAEIYGYTTRAFNQQVKNNIEKFPEDFRFQLTREEVEELRSKYSTVNISSMSRSNPYVFTESGIYMLMSILRGELATRQSISLIRLFKGMKDYLIENQSLISQRSYTALVERVEKHSSDINAIKEAMVTKAELSDFIKLFDSGVSAEEILILNGQPFKADLAYQTIFRKAKKSIIIVDDYIGIKTLHHLTKAKATVKITIISDNKKKTLRLQEYNDFMTEYPQMNISFIKTANKAHDRYIILDNGASDMRVYHCGGSSKDSGKKITTITQISDITEYKSMIKTLLANAPLVLK